VPDVSASRAELVRGPLPVRIQHPILLTFPSLGLRRAATLEPGAIDGAWEVSYATIYEQAVHDGYDVRIDAELARTALRVGWGAADGVDLTAHLGALHAGGGSLDNFISGWHEFFGFPNSGRDDVGDDEFEVHVEHEGESAFELEPNELGLEDLGFELGVALERSAHRSQLARAVVELPTGSEGDGFGNGEVDFGLGWALEATSGRWTAFASLGWVHPGRADGFVRAGVELEELFELGVALEIRWTDSTSLVAQLDGTTPLVDEIPMEELDSPMLDLALGVVTDLGSGSRAFLSFDEDVISHAGPDFAVFAGVIWSQ